MSYHDQRQQSRKIFRTVVTILVDRAHIYHAKSIDISQTGICLIVPGKNLIIGSTCHIMFDLVVQGKAHKIQVAVKVIYSICMDEGFKTGLQFIKIDAAADAAIQTFIF
ncbi:MAG: PilZ domain-containing protein [Pseudomonadota bacterium]